MEVQHLQELGTAQQWAQQMHTLPTQGPQHFAEVGHPFQRVELGSAPPSQSATAKNPDNISDMLQVPMCSADHFVRQNSSSFSRFEPSCQAPPVRVVQPPARDKSQKAKHISEGAALRRRTLVVAKFPRTMSDLALAGAFGSLVGEESVVHCRIVRSDTGCCRGYAFVEFLDARTADEVEEACGAGQLVLVDKRGRHCVVTASRAKRATAGPTRARSAVSNEDLRMGAIPSGELRMIL